MYIQCLRSCVSAMRNSHSLTEHYHSAFVYTQVADQLIHEVMVPSKKVLPCGESKYTGK